MSKLQTPSDASVIRAAHSIAEHCRQYGISRASYYNLKRAGLGPREMRVGRSVRITTEAAAEWRKRLEAGATGPAK